MKKYISILLLFLIWILSSGFSSEYTIDIKEKDGKNYYTEHILIYDYVEEEKDNLFKGYDFTLSCDDMCSEDTGECYYELCDSYIATKEYSNIEDFIKSNFINKYIGVISFNKLNEIMNLQITPKIDENNNILIQIISGKKTTNNNPVLLWESKMTSVPIIYSFYDNIEPKKIYYSNEPVNEQHSIMNTIIISVIILSFFIVLFIVYKKSKKNNAI